MISTTLRVQLYEFCARLVFREVDDETLLALRQSQVLDMLKTLEPKIDEELSLEQSALIATYEEEFARLFVLPDGVNPHASAWFGAEPTQQGAWISEKVQDWCEQLSVELRLSEWGRLPKDHFAVLVGLLAVTQLRAENNDKFGAVAAEIEALVIAPWLNSFAIALTDKANLCLYRAVGKILQVLLDKPSLVEEV